MSHIQQFETSFKTTEGKHNTIACADLDDHLISQALSILQCERPGKKASGFQPGAGDQPNPGDIIPPIVDGARRAGNEVKRVRTSDANTSGQEAGGPGGKDQRGDTTIRPSDKPKTGGMIPSIIKGILEVPCEPAPNRCTSSQCDSIDQEQLFKPVPNREMPRTVGDALGELAKPSEYFLCRAELPRSDGNGVRELTKPSEIFLCRAELPRGSGTRTSDLTKPSEIFLCRAEIPQGMLPKIIGSKTQDAPNDVILCSEKIPTTGVKPKPGTYYACVHYYPYKLKDVNLQSY